MTTVQGTAKNNDGTAYVGTITFRPLTGPTVESTSFYRGDQVTKSTTDGTFSITLAAGDYDAIVGSARVLISVPAGSDTERFEDLIANELTYTQPALPWFAPSLNEQLLAWAADGGRFIQFVPTYVAGLLSTATVKWPDGTAGVFTVDFINPLYESVDEYHVTYLGTTTKTVTQPRITRNADGQATDIPLMTVT